MENLKIKFNHFLEKLTGYNLIKIDSSAKKYRNILKKFLIDNSKSFNGNVLDIGAGSFIWPRQNFKHLCNYKTIDNQKYDGINIVGDITNLTKIIQPNSQDLILILEVLEHVKNPTLTIEQIYQCLKNEGCLILSVPFNYEMHGEDYGDYWRFTRQGLKEILYMFKNIEITSVGKNKLNPHHFIVKATK